MKQYLLQIIDIDGQGNELGVVSVPISEDVVLLKRALDLLLESIHSNGRYTSQEVKDVVKDYRLIIEKLIKKVKGIELEDNFDIYDGEGDVLIRVFVDVTG